MPYCQGCNTHWVDTGCDQQEDHARCPLPCGLCARPVTGRDDGCRGHSLDEVLRNPRGRRGPTFMDDYWAGRADSPEPYVEQWAYRRDAVTLWAHLGLTFEQYRRWIEEGALPERGAP